MTRLLRVVFAALLVLLPACQMTVRMSTDIDASGGGSFTLAMEFDRELVEQLTAADAQGGEGQGLSAIEALFDGLAAKKWTVTRGAPGDGMSLEATRRFTDRAGFDGALAELRTARAGERSRLDGIKLAIGYRTQRSLLRTRSEFTGEIDTTGGVPVDEEALRAVQELVRFEIRADLPGVAEVTSGDGVTGGSRVVWRPLVGTRSVFAATSTAVRVGPLLGVLVPSLLVVAGLAWAALARRRKPTQQPATVLDSAVVPEVKEPDSGDR
ncbi:MAG: hypothetical protein WDA27_05805 [Actinomycetota bacterium]